MTSKLGSVHVIGGGLAGSEAAWQLAQAGVPAVLHEMRAVRRTEAHKTDRLAELVCSNSFRSDDAVNNAVGLLHEEMRRCGSLILAAGDAHKLPAGGALAVDRDGFAETVTARLTAHPLVTIQREEIAGVPPSDWDQVIVATGPLTSPALADAIQRLTGESALAFFDAIAPIVHRESIDFERAWFQSRYDKGGPAGDGADYINCAFDKAPYLAFVEALLAGEKTEFKDWEKDTPYFEGCLPIEVMAARGLDTLRFGPMKPVGLTDPNTARRPYAVVQLRQDNIAGDHFSLVGFQTQLKWGEQERVLRLIPGLEHAEFVRFGMVHRNTYVNGPAVLSETWQVRRRPSLFLAGQMSGVEGYVESAASGLLAGLNAAALAKGETPSAAPRTTAIGALAYYVSHANPAHYEPSNITFGIMPPLGEDALPHGQRKNKLAKKLAVSERALGDLQVWMQRLRPVSNGQASQRVSAVRPA